MVDLHPTHRERLAALISETDTDNKDGMSCKQRFGISELESEDQLSSSSSKNGMSCKQIFSTSELESEDQLPSFCSKEKVKNLDDLVPEDVTFQKDVPAFTQTQDGMICKQRFGTSELESEDQLPSLCSKEKVKSLEDLVPEDVTFQKDVPAFTQTQDGMSSKRIFSISESESEDQLPYSSHSKDGMNCKRKFSISESESEDQLPYSSRSKLKIEMESMSSDESSDNSFYTESSYSDNDNDKLFKNRVYDEHGIHIATNKDLCDCFDLGCPGCWNACKKCGSHKCGHKCRINRSWAYEEAEVEGTNVILKNPFCCDQ